MLVTFFVQLVDAFLDDAMAPLRLEERNVWSIRTRPKIKKL